MNLVLSPVNGGTISISASTSNARTALGAALGTTLRIVNSGSVVTFVKFGDSTVTATSADLPLLGNTSVVVAIPTGTTYVAALTASSTATVYVTPCFGGI